MSAEIRLDRVPSRLIVREIDEFTADMDEETILRCRTGLFERAGVCVTNYRKWARNPLSGMDFRVADRLMTAMGKSFHWWVNPELNEHYMRVDLTDTPSSWAERRNRKPKSCPVCRTEFAPVGRKAFCTARCKDAFRRRRIRAVAS